MTVQTEIVKWPDLIKLNMKRAEESALSSSSIFTKAELPSKGASFKLYIANDDSLIKLKK